MEYKTSQNAPLFVYDKSDLNDLKKDIKTIEKDFLVKEVDLVFKEERLIYNTLLSSDDAYKFIKEIIYEGIEIQEHFIVLFLNHANKVIGYYRHTKGTINSTQVDIEVLVAVAIKILAKSLIVSHNHPSGNVTPSEQDRELTQKLKNACKFFDINVLDHIIATKNDYYSFADHADSSLSGYSKKEETGGPNPENELREEILFQLKKITKANSPNLWQRIRTKDGYRKLEEEIIRRVILHHMIPAAVIPQMESELELD